MKKVKKETQRTWNAVDGQPKAPPPRATGTLSNLTGARQYCSACNGKFTTSWKDHAESCEYFSKGLRNCKWCNKTFPYVRGARSVEYFDHFVNCPTVTCGYCKEGHHISMCPTKRCRKCRGTGHNDGECTSQQGRRNQITVRSKLTPRGGMKVGTGAPITELRSHIRMDISDSENPRRNHIIVRPKLTPRGGMNVVINVPRTESGSLNNASDKGSSTDIPNVESKSPLDLTTEDSKVPQESPKVIHLDHVLKCLS